MNTKHSWLVAAALVGGIALSARSQVGASKPNGANADRSARESPVKPAILRRPGFVFVELGTQNVADYITFFREVGGFELVRNETTYAEMRTDCGQLLIVHPSILPKGHPFHEKLTGSGHGLGVEIGIVVADLDRTFAAASKFQKTWRISSGIAMRPWGVRDFRVLSPEGYYLRFTEPTRPPDHD